MFPIEKIVETSLDTGHHGLTELPIMSLFSLDSLCWPGTVEFFAILYFLSTT